MQTNIFLNDDARVVASHLSGGTWTIELIEDRQEVAPDKVVVFVEKDSARALAHAALQAYIDQGGRYEDVTPVPDQPIRTCRFCEEGIARGADGAWYGTTDPDDPTCDARPVGAALVDGRGHVPA